MKRLKLRGDLTEPERTVIETPLGELAPLQIAAATWLAEGVAVLAWSLRAGELPQHDRKIDPIAVAERLGFLEDDAEHRFGLAVPRERQELFAYHELAYAVHSRLRDALRNRGSCDFAAWIDERWLQLLGVDRQSLFVDRDLSVEGTAVFAAPEGLVQLCEWIASERHRAIRWLCGLDVAYSATAPDT